MCLYIINQFIIYFVMCSITSLINSFYLSWCVQLHHYSIHFIFRDVFIYIINQFIIYFVMCSNTSLINSFYWMTCSNTSLINSFYFWKWKIQIFYIHPSIHPSIKLNSLPPLHYSKKVHRAIYYTSNNYIVMFSTNISNAYKVQGNNIIKANNNGNKTVQQKDINWSKRILGNEALTQIKINTKSELFTPKIRLYHRPLSAKVLTKFFIILYSGDSTQSISNTYAHILFIKLNQYNRLNPNK
uniref:Uncharacterized protein n=1 Tax=Colletotrichum lindemuthianum TaxID=290576 RepID=A0A2D2AJ43_COLLN|nr:hypothetical protein [Colletotrichum lindemuthianum]ATQ37181.1 hypothetical protein [Colletotrichum lindemuthianum]